MRWIDAMTCAPGLLALESRQDGIAFRAASHPVKSPLMASKADRSTFAKTGELRSGSCPAYSRPRVRWPDGRGAPAKGRRGKSGLHGDTVTDNIRRGRPQGQRHRNDTA